MLQNLRECLVGNWNQKCPQSNFFSNDPFNLMRHSPASKKNTNWGYVQEPKNLQCNIELATPRPACAAALESDMDFGNLSFRDQSTVALPSCSKTPPFLTHSYIQFHVHIGDTETLRAGACALLHTSTFRVLEGMPCLSHFHGYLLDQSWLVDNDTDLRFKNTRHHWHHSTSSSNAPDALNRTKPTLGPKLS